MDEKNATTGRDARDIAKMLQMICADWGCTQAEAVDRLICQHYDRKNAEAAHLAHWEERSTSKWNYGVPRLKLLVQPHWTEGEVSPAARCFLSDINSGSMLGVLYIELIDVLEACAPMVRIRKEIADAQGDGE